MILIAQVGICKLKCKKTIGKLYFVFCIITRFLWLGVVTAAIVIFIGQVGNRVAVFFQYKTNVAVKVKYLKAIDYPSVTICNQNNFRFVE